MHGIYLDIHIYKSKCDSVKVDVKTEDYRNQDVLKF